MAAALDAEPGSKAQCGLFLAYNLGQVKLPSSPQLKTGSDFSPGIEKGK